MAAPVAPSVAARCLGSLLSGATTPRSLSATPYFAALHVADVHGLAPHLWATGLRGGWWADLPADVRAAVRRHVHTGVSQPELALQDAFDANAARLADLLDQGAAVGTAFAAAGVPFVRLKGWHTVTAGWWPSPAERTMTDLDVLVHAPQAEVAADALAGVGYLPIASGHTDRADHELPPVALPGRAGSVEVHREVLLSRWRRILRGADVMAMGPSLSTEVALVHLVAHAQLHDDALLLGRLPLRAVREFSVCVEAASAGRIGAIDWDAVARPFHDGGQRLALATHAALAAELFGTPLPPEVVPGNGLRRSARAACTRVMWNLDHTRWATRAERAVYLPRAWGPTRLRGEYGVGLYPVLLARHLGRRLPGRT